MFLFGMTCNHTKQQKFLFGMTCNHTKQQKVLVWDDIRKVKQQHVCIFSFVILDLRILLIKCESRIHALALNTLLGHGSQTLNETAKVPVWDDIRKVKQQHLCIFSFVIIDLRILLFECESRIHALALNTLLGHGSQTLIETAKTSFLGL